MRSKNENLCDILADEELRKAFGRKEHFTKGK